MKESLVKLLRHFLAALAGWLMTHGIDGVDSTSSASLLAGVVLFVVSWFWSYIHKGPMAVTTLVQLRMFVMAFAQQGIAALAGYLQAAGHPITADDPTALILFAANLGFSKVFRPDVKLPSVEEIQRTGLILAALILPLALNSCNALSGGTLSAGVSGVQYGQSYHAEIAIPLGQRQGASTSAKTAQDVLPVPSGK